MATPQNEGLKVYIARKVEQIRLENEERDRLRAEGRNVKPVTDLIVQFVVREDGQIFCSTDWVEQGGASFAAIQAAQHVQKLVLQRASRGE